MKVVSKSAKDERAQCALDGQISTRTQMFGELGETLESWIKHHIVLRLFHATQLSFFDLATERSKEHQETENTTAGAAVAVAVAARNLPIRDGG